jgi:hypothetical protein
MIVKYKNIIFGTIVGFIFLGISGVAQASAVVWTGASTDNTSDEFDVGTLSFTAFGADSLDSIVGSGYFNDQGFNTADFTLELRLDNVWTQIWTQEGDTGNADTALSTIAPPAISFALASLDGIRLSVDPVLDFGYLSVDSTQFSFSASAVPVPAAIWLFGTALIGLVGFGKRRKVA